MLQKPFFYQFYIVFCIPGFYLRLWSGLDFTFSLVGNEMGSDTGTQGYVTLEVLGLSTSAIP